MGWGIQCQNMSLESCSQAPRVHLATTSHSTAKTLPSGSPGTAAGEGRLKPAFTVPPRDRLHFYGQNWTITAPLFKASLTTVWVPAAHQRAMSHTQGQAPCSRGEAGADPSPNEEPQLGSSEWGAHEVLGTKTWCGARVSMPPRPSEGILYKNNYCHTIQ